jgi:hypothetical protein
MRPSMCGACGRGAERCDCHSAARKGTEILGNVPGEAHMQMIARKALNRRKAIAKRAALAHHEPLPFDSAATLLALRTEAARRVVAGGYRVVRSDEGDGVFGFGTSYGLSASDLVAYPEETKL